MTDGVLYKIGRPTCDRPRVEVRCKLEEGLHSDVLRMMGAVDLSLTDMMNILVAIALPIVSAHPEVVSTLKEKYFQSQKK